MYAFNHAFRYPFGIYFHLELDLYSVALKIDGPAGVYLLHLKDVCYYNHRPKLLVNKQLNDVNILVDLHFQHHLMYL